MFLKIWLFLKRLDPIKLALDSFTVVILLSFIVEFFQRHKIAAVESMAELYLVALPSIVAFREMNRWWPFTDQESQDLPWNKQPKIIQGEYYVWAWISLPVAELFMQVIFPGYFPHISEKLLTLSLLVITAFLASSGSKKIKQEKDHEKRLHQRAPKSPVRLKRKPRCHY